MSKHTATTKEEHVLDRDNKTQESLFYLEQSAQPIRPPGTEYIGTLAVHVYASGLQADRQIMFASHSDTEVPEAICDLALKDLREKCMSSYGRKQPKRIQ